MDAEYKKYMTFIMELNRAGPADDEYEVLAAYLALTAQYNLDRYPTPLIVLRRERAATAAQTGGIFPYCGGEPSCRE